MILCDNFHDIQMKIKNISTVLLGHNTTCGAGVTFSKAPSVVVLPPVFTGMLMGFYRKIQDFTGILQGFAKIP